MVSGEGDKMAEGEVEAWTERLDVSLSQNASGGGEGRAQGAPEHSRGGFACVLLDHEYQVVYV